MKKILLVLFVLTLAAAPGFSLEYNNDSGGSITLEAIQLQTGYVNNMGMVNTLANGTNPDSPYIVGLNMGLDNRAIFTFDTSAIPADADIYFVHLWVNVTIQDDNYMYIFENTAVDFAFPCGFGGSHIITSFDYYALPAASFYTVLGNAAAGGLMLNLDINQNQRDLNPYINRNGKTQIRLRFFLNPALLSAYYYGIDEYPPDGTFTTKLIIGWN